jgi:CheY-like chemotaxis protein
VTSVDPPRAATVLVVDDQPAPRYIAASWLRRSGHRVVEVSTGGEALSALHDQAIDIVVLDVGLPDMSGFEVCHRIKSDPALGHPVVHLSATSIQGRDRAHGLDRGADAYLTDPVEPGELVATVNSVLRYYRARAEAEELARQLGALSRATLAMNGTTTVDPLVAAVAMGAAEIAGVPAVALVPTSALHLRRATAPGGGGPPAVSSCPPEVLTRLVRQLSADAGSGAVREVTGDQLGGSVGTSWAVLSSSRSGHAPICIAVASEERPSDRAIEILVQLGNAAVMAVDAQRLYEQEHNLALTLQRSFLPDRMPEVPGLSMAVRYHPAVQGVEVGGDFYEVVQLPDGRLLVAMGDVAGHSIHAATIMIELRHAVRAYALDGHGPSAILARIERVLRHYYHHEYATLCLLLLDLELGTLDVANAGHPPPLVVGSGGAAYVTAVGPMLGVGLPHPPETTTRLDGVRTIVLYTDGLIEDRPVDIDAAMERLRLWPSFDLPPEDLCDDLLAHFGQDKSDDVALFVLRWTSGPA